MAYETGSFFVHLDSFSSYDKLSRLLSYCRSLIDQSGRKSTVVRMVVSGN